MPPALLQIKDILAFGQSKLVSKEEMSALITALTKFIKSYKEVQIEEVRQLRESVKTDKEELKEMAVQHKQRLDKKADDILQQLSQMRDEIIALIPPPADFSALERRFDNLTILSLEDVKKEVSLESARNDGQLSLKLQEIEKDIEELEKKLRGDFGAALSSVSRSRLGVSGQSVIVPRQLKSISTDTTPAISGAINGTNTDFTLPKAPLYRRGEPYGIMVFLNGVRMREGASNDYTISGRTLVFVNAPFEGNTIVCDIEY